MRSLVGCASTGFATMAIRQAARTPISFVVLCIVVTPTLLCSELFRGRAVHARFQPCIRVSGPCGMVIHDPRALMQEPFRAGRKLESERAQCRRPSGGQAEQDRDALSMIRERPLRGFPGGESILDP